MGHWEDLRERINTKGDNSYTDSFRVVDLQFVSICVNCVSFLSCSL
jgi:hypothetical protein